MVHRRISRWSPSYRPRSLLSRRAVVRTVNSTRNDPTKKTETAALTKMELVTEIYKRMRIVKDVTRKDIIKKFIAGVKLTKAGESTCLQVIKDKPQEKTDTS
ncbi:hypothetical protein [Burkholderia sp.]|uniref:hypothetical protein n=1 Tax=Burkholderia sp. TaxID=36773 RepID=UPI0025C3745C|nr:hypothetical protein [Burkholderia sp.]